jgi:WD40 repeat protein
MKTQQTICSIAVAAALQLALAPTAGAAPPKYTAWTLAAPVVEVNDDTVPDGCPIESRDGLSLYIASTRTGTLGGNDIWAADRASKSELFGEPQNLGSPVNGPANDFCPTPIYGSYLMFVSERPSEDGKPTCNAGPGLGDIYIIRRNAAFGWGEPQHLGCIEDGTGPSSVGAEFSPSLVDLEDGTYLYFSSTASGNHDIYRSKRLSNGKFGPPSPVTELNTEFDDRMPNISSDGLEVVFSSTRPADAKGKPNFGPAGTFDVYYARRNNTKQKFSAPVNLGSNVNGPGNETRSTISWDRKRLYFGRDGQIYSASRKKKSN